MASQAALPLRAFMNTTSAHKRRASENTDPNADEPIGHEKAKSKPSMLSGLAKTLKGVAPVKPKVVSEKLPKKSTATLKWLLQRRASLPEGSVLRAFQTEGFATQLGKDCLKQMQMTRSSTNADVQCQYLELIEAVLAIGQKYMHGYYYQVMRDLASPAMVDHLYECLGRFTNDVKIQQYAMKIFGHFFHENNVREDTFTRLNEVFIEKAIAPIVRAMETHPDDVVVQTSALKLFHQYTYKPEYNARGALVATPGCMEALAAASNNNTILSMAPNCVRTTTKIFHSLVAEMTHNIKQLEVSTEGQKEHHRRQNARKKALEKRATSKQLGVAHKKLPQQEDDYRYLRSLHQYYPSAYLTHQRERTDEI